MLRHQHAKQERKGAGGHVGSWDQGRGSGREGERKDCVREWISIMAGPCKSKRMKKMKGERMGGREAERCVDFIKVYIKIYVLRGKAGVRGGGCGGGR